MEFPNKMGAIMQEKQVSEDQLAYLADLTRMTVYNAKKGKNIMLGNAIKIAKALGEPVEKIWFFPESEEAA